MSHIHSMTDYDEDGRLIICRAKQLDKIPEICYNCNSDDLQMIMTHVDEVVGYVWTVIA